MESSNVGGAGGSVVPTVTMTAVHSIHLWGLACEARDRAIETASKDREAVAPDATVALILSAAAVEGFINELPEQCHPNPNKIIITNVPETLRRLYSSIEEVERSRGSSQLKYLVASLVLSGTMYRKDSSPFQDFNTLLELRNLILHLKQ